MQLQDVLVVTEPNADQNRNKLLHPMTSAKLVLTVSYTVTYSKSPIIWRPVLRKSWWFGILSWGSFLSFSDNSKKNCGKKENTEKWTPVMHRTIQFRTHVDAPISKRKQKHRHKRWKCQNEQTWGRVYASWPRMACLVLWFLYKHCWPHCHHLALTLLQMSL